MNVELTWNIDGWIIVAGALCALASSLVGNLLLLRRMSLMGDAISHAVLPGIAAAFVLSGSRSSVVVLIGAAAMGLVTVWMTEAVQRYGHVEESASIGVVFTALFAIGLVIMVRAGDKIDLDPSCVLYGNLETVILVERIPTPLGNIPRVVITLGCICLLNAAAVGIFFKQWQLTTFDPSLAESQGISAIAFRYLLAALVALTCIASFEAVGNILVVAMLVVPSSIGFLLCRRLAAMVVVSGGAAILVAIVGHLSAVGIPSMFGLRSVNSAAMMGVICGLFLFITIFASPKSGLIPRWWIRQRVQQTIQLEDLLALLYRAGEANLQDSSRTISHDTARKPTLTASELAHKMKISESRVKSLARELIRKQWITEQNQSWELTPAGFGEATNLVRSHRLWEHYLAAEVGVADPRLHAQAESLEHYTSPEMRGKLDAMAGKPPIDPHGRNIPPESLDSHTKGDP